MKKSAQFSSELQSANSVYPKVENPFFIVTPPYTRISAGITVLHLICHYLNTNGENAFICHYPPERDESRFLPPYAGLQRSPEYPGGLMAPLITQQVIDYYHEKKITPILIYPEVFDNPFNAKFFTRYILNYPGLLAPQYEQQAAYMFGYTKTLKDASGANETLYIPTCDLNFFNRSGEWKERKGTCYYAGKLKSFLGGQPENVPEGSIEILHSTHMTREEVRDIFWKSEAFYCYEDTALATEAMLCGCPTVFVKNDKFSGAQLAGFEHGTDGSCTFEEPNGLKRAQATVDLFEKRIRQAINDVPEKIQKVAEDMKAIVRKLPYQGTIDYTYEPRLVFFDKLALSEVGFRQNEQIPAVPDAGSQAEPPALQTTEVNHNVDILNHINEKLDQLKSAQSAFLTGTAPTNQIPDSNVIAELEFYRKQLEGYRGQTENLENALEATRRSTSWKITAPIRKVVSLFRRK